MTNTMALIPHINSFTTKGSLAYLTSVTHGIENDQVESIKSRMEADNIQIPKPDPDASLILPSPPVQQMHSANQESPNWPLLTVSRDFFEVAMLSRTQNTMSSNQTGANALLATAGDMTEADWGEDAEMQIDDEEEHFEDAKDDGEAGWDIDDSLEIPSELLNDVSNDKDANSGGIYVPPLTGRSPMQVWSDNSNLVIDQVKYPVYLVSTLSLVHIIIISSCLLS